MKSLANLNHVIANVFVSTRRRKVAGFYREVASSTSMPGVYSSAFGDAVGTLRICGEGQLSPQSGL